MSIISLQTPFRCIGSQYFPATVEPRYLQFDQLLPGDLETNTEVGYVPVHKENKLNPS